VSFANRIGAAVHQRAGTFGAPEKIHFARRVTQSSTTPPTSMDARVGADGATDRGRAVPVIRGTAVIEFCDPLQKLDTAGFLP
jgi:hypothetical protein